MHLPQCGCGRAPLSEALKWVLDRWSIMCSIGQKSCELVQQIWMIIKKYGNLKIDQQKPPRILNIKNHQLSNKAKQQSNKQSHNMYLTIDLIYVLVLLPVQIQNVKECFINTFILLKAFL